MPGFSPVQKFTDRKTAIARIWKAAQSLVGNNGSASPQVEANKSGSSSKSRSSKAARAQRAAKPAPYARQPGGAREGSNWAGSNSGSLYRFDLHGVLRERHRLGRGWVKACVREDGSLAAAYCSPVFPGIADCGDGDPSGILGGLGSERAIT
jgi:hypothetical protein